MINCILFGKLGKVKVKKLSGTIGSKSSRSLSLFLYPSSAFSCSSLTRVPLLGSTAAASNSKYIILTLPTD